MDYQEENNVAKIFRFLGCIVIILGFFAGIFAALKTVEVWGYYRTQTKTVFSWSTALTIWAISFISSMFYFGFAEVISLLQKLVDKPSADPAVIPSARVAAVRKAAAPGSTVPVNPVLNALPACEKYSQILELWQQNNMDLDETLAVYTKKIQHKAENEKLYGSEATYVKVFAENLAAELRSMR